MSAFWRPHSTNACLRQLRNKRNLTTTQARESIRSSVRISAVNVTNLSFCDELRGTESKLHTFYPHGAVSSPIHAHCVREEPTITEILSNSTYSEERGVNLAEKGDFYITTWRFRESAVLLTMRKTQKTICSTCLDDSGHNMHVRASLDL